MGGPIHQQDIGSRGATDKGPQAARPQPSWEPERAMSMNSSMPEKATISSKRRSVAALEKPSTEALM